MRAVLRRWRRRRDPDPATPAPGVVSDTGIIERAAPYTMTSPERLQALIDAVRYCVAREFRAPSSSAASGAAGRSWP